MTEERFLVCDERDWEGLTHEQREWMTFKTLRSIDKRLLALENRNFLYNALATVGGVIDFASGVASTTTGNTGGLLGGNGYATVDGTDWAVG